jgi:anti-anti-sigma factor
MARSGQPSRQDVPSSHSATFVRPSRTAWGPLLSCRANCCTGNLQTLDHRRQATPDVGTANTDHRYAQEMAIENAPEAFELAVTREAKVTIVHVVGDFDIDAQPRWNTVVDDLRPIFGTLVVDLARLRFIDSSGLSALHDLQETCVADGRSAPLIRNCSPATLRLFQLSGLADYFDTRD